MTARGLALLSVTLLAPAWSAEPEPLPDNAAISAGFAVPSKSGIGPGTSATPTAGGFDLSDYERQIAAMPARPRIFSTEKMPAKIPADFAPTWIRGQRTRIGGTGSSRILSAEELYRRALQHSKQIRVFSDLPLIRETGIQEAKGAFDTNTFLQGKFGHTNDPVGNTLTTGGASRFKQDEWAFEAGARKKFVTGTEVTLSQKLGNLDNNSIYFVPNPQSTASLALSVVQPLLRGAGLSYNRSVMQIAKIDSQVAMREFIRQSESHLLEITRTYWALYAARVTYLQKAKLVDETGRVADEVRARQQVDARQTQLFRAQSALASRRSDLIRTEAAVRNAQDRLRALTSDPELLDAPDSELIPADRLILSSPAVDMQAAAHAALQNRPEITQAFLQLQAATIREKMARNELMPELNLVLEGSLGGLTGDDVATAYGRQYNTGGPGYGVGLVFSFPLENNIGRATLERRRIEMRQQLSQIKTTIDTVLLEVKVSAREVATAYRETQAKYEAVRAFTEDLETLQARRGVQELRDEVQASNYLDTVLDAQDRRSDAEEEFIRAAANYQIAVVNLQRAKGNLLVYSDVTVMRGKDEKNLPQLWLEKGARSGKTTYEAKPAR
jgi:outer membrane protein TolC